VWDEDFYIFFIFLLLQEGVIQKRELIVSFGCWLQIFGFWGMKILINYIKSLGNLRENKGEKGEGCCHVFFFNSIIKL